MQIRSRIERLERTGEHGSRFLAVVAAFDEYDDAEIDAVLPAHIKSDDPRHLIIVVRKRLDQLSDPEGPKLLYTKPLV